MGKVNLRFLLIITALGFVACGPKVEKRVQKIDIPQYSSLKNIKDGPEVIKKVSKAVVLVRLAGGSGTGFFVSEDGLLMTNEHVLGRSSCPKEGCYISLGIDHQLGADYQASESVFAEPVFVDPLLDFAIYQIKNIEDGKVSANYQSPDYLKISARSADSLLGENVHIVGHPHGMLKKWSSGKVYSNVGDWISYDGFSLPGNSGSPVINDQGEMVAINHRGQNSRGNLTRNSYQSSAIGTASGAITAALDRVKDFSLSEAGVKSVDTLISFEKIKEEEIVAEVNLFSSARRLPVVENLSAKHPIVSALAKSCDEILENPPKIAADRLAQKIRLRCFKSMSWFNCNDEEVSKDLLTCPVESEKKLWIARFKKAADLIDSINQGKSYWRIASGSSKLVSGKEKYTVGNAALISYLDEAEVKLSFSVAQAKISYANSYSDFSYQGVDLSDYLKNYIDQDYFERSYDVIVSSQYAIFKVTKGELISEDLVASTIKAALANPETSLELKLSIEEFAYRKGFL